VVDDLDLRGHPRTAAGAVLDYARKPLVVDDPDGNERAALVRHQLLVHLGGSVVLGDRFRVAVSAPLAAYQDGEATSLNGVALAPADAPALGDVRLTADASVLGHAKEPLRLAVGARLWLPTGSRREFMSDGAARVGPQAMIAGELGPVTYGARLALVYRAPRSADVTGHPLGSELAGAVGAGLTTRDRRLTLGPELSAATGTSPQASLSTRGTAVEWLLGAHYEVRPSLRLGAGGGAGLTRGLGSPAARALLSVAWVEALPQPKRDRDGDRVPDDVDACPEEAGVPDRDPELNGCPALFAPLPDRDQDTIADPFDACPDEPGVPSPEAARNGCPEDQDGDGIVDARDACPKEPGPESPDPTRSGCPRVTVTATELAITEQLRFAFDSAELLAESDAVLEAVRAALVAHSEILKLRVEGHTDDVGDPAYNKELSARRAASVARWLTERGVAPQRLFAQGFGGEQPIDTNATEEGRARNRRVAFTILERARAAEVTSAPAPPPK
jgi:outer membrane protein OmpA-like peptidoglycan-associated protein